MLSCVLFLASTLGVVNGQGAVNTGGQYDPNSGPSDPIQRPPLDYRPYASSDDVGPGWHYSSYPNPRRDLIECRRNAPSYVCDPDAIISQRDANELDALAADIQRDTPCPCSTKVCSSEGDKGYVVAVALMNKFRRPVRSGKSLIEDFRSWIASMEKHRWNFDKCDDDITLVFSLHDSIAFTATGLTARQKLTDQLLHEITVDAREYFAHSIFMGLKHILYGIRFALRDRMDEYRRERDWHRTIYSYQYYRGDRSSNKENRVGRVESSRQGNGASSQTFPSKVVLIATLTWFLLTKKVN